jgi:aldehyde dehydrogenase (NAD+)
MEHVDQFYIGGQWVAPHGDERRAVVNPATEREVTSVAMGTSSDVDDAVAAARRAFATFSVWMRGDRLELLHNVIKAYAARSDEFVEVLSTEMGAPLKLAREDQVPAGLGQFRQAAAALTDFELDLRDGSTEILYEPVGVCALITPWNWPLLLIASKVAPALAAGCTMVLKPSELAPLSAIVFAHVMAEAGVPPGVFNLVHGDGETVGAALSRHPDVDLVSITGSTRAGVEVARNAAGTVKRVHQELGGKSAHIMLPDVELDVTLPKALWDVMENSGQSCNARTRILVPRDQMDRAKSIASHTASLVVVGSPDDLATDVGPVVSCAQYDKIQGMISRALDQGAHLVAGGLGRPEGLSEGYYVRPTVLSDVANDMEIAREEVFGPVVTLIAYDDEDDAVRIANDTPYGLSGAVSSSDIDRARRVARRIRAGMVHINGKGIDGKSPFGGYKQSGNGREYGEFGLREFLEVKSVFGFNP